MASPTAASSSDNTYDYMDESQIDDELKCPICTRPFQLPVSLPCQHTFCQTCLEHWLDENHSCPTCREYPTRGNNEDGEDSVVFSPVNTQIVTNQLDRLLVRCNQCEEMNILRGNFSDHELKCPKRLISCPSVDLQCPWKGSRDEEEKHVQECSFHRIRPIIDVLRNELDVSQQIQTELRERLDQQSNQLNFLLAFINQGHPMNRQCSKPNGKCQYTSRNQYKPKITYLCTLCEGTIRRRDVTLHACAMDETIACICQSCYEKQYSAAEESNDDGADDDQDPSITE